MKKTIITFIAVIAASFLFNCAKDYREVIKAPEEKFYQNQELEAARMLLPMVNKSGRDQLLFMMEAGYMLHIARKYEDSNKVLLQAAKIAKIKPVSVSKQVSALLTNQTKTNYRGEDFEKVLLHMILGINFLKLENYEAATVEFKAVNNELKKITNENGQSRYKQNIMAKYLAAIAHELLADIEDSEEDREWAEVEYRQILKLNPRLQMVRHDLMMLRQNKPNMGELVVIFQAGRSPIKVSRGKLLGDPRMNNEMNVAFSNKQTIGAITAGVTLSAILIALKTAENPIPKFVRRTNRTKHLRITVLGRQVTTTMLENVEYTAIKNLEDDYNRLAGKVAGSIILKAAVSIAAGLAAKAAADELSKKKGIGSLVGLIVGASTGTALFASMKPDLRCWHTLPANFQLARMRLPQGKYTVNIDFVGHNGAVQRRETVNIEIKKKNKHFLNIRTME